MTENKFSIEEALSFGWDTFSKHIRFFMLLMLCVFVVFSFLGFLQELAKALHPSGFVLLNIFVIAFNIIVSIGLIKIALSFVHNQKPSIRAAFVPHAHTFFPYVVGSFLYALIVIAGFILLIIPGFMWAIKYQFFGYFLIDQSCEPREALRRSARATQGVRLKLFGMFIVLTVLNVIGALLFGVGLLVTIPVTLLAMGFVYQKLKLHTESNEALRHVDPGNVPHSPAATV